MFSNNFEDLAWLFASDNRNRKIIRQNIDEAAFLWKMVRVTSGPILEIGRKYGGSTVLLLWAGDGRPVTSIDFNPKHNDYCENIFNKIHKDSPELLNLIIGDSRKTIINSSYGFAFVDGDHSYDGVRQDVYAHWNSLKKFNNCDPIIVFHDAVINDGLSYINQINHSDGVVNFCNELVVGGYAAKIGSAGSSLALKKLSDLPKL